MTPRHRSRQRGQAITELALSSVVLLLLLTGLLDFARVFYFTSALRGTAFDAARHAAWFDNFQLQNKWLDDDVVTAEVNKGLTGAHLANVSGVQGTCPTPSDGNSAHNPPFASSLYPTGTNQTYLYVCYTKPDGTVYGTLPTSGTPSYPPASNDNSWHLGDVNVILLFNYGLITGFMQQELQALGGIQVATNAHFTIQGSQ
jgi:TadE-like protein